MVILPASLVKDYIVKLKPLDSSDYYETNDFESDIGLQIGLCSLGVTEIADLLLRV